MGKCCSLSGRAGKEDRVGKERRRQPDGSACSDGTTEDNRANKNHDHSIDLPTETAEHSTSVSLTQQDVLEGKYMSSSHHSAVGTSTQAALPSSAMSSHLVQQQFGVDSLFGSNTNEWIRFTQAIMVLCRPSMLTDEFRKWIRLEIAALGGPSECLDYIDSYEAGNWSDRRKELLMRHPVIVKMRHVILYIFFKLHQAMEVDAGRYVPVRQLSDLGVEAEAVNRIRDLVDHELFNKKERMHLLFPDGHPALRREQSLHVF